MTISNFTSNTQTKKIELSPVKYKLEDNGQQSKMNSHATTTTIEKVEKKVEKKVEEETDWSKFKVDPEKELGPDYDDNYEKIEHYDRETPYDTNIGEYTPAQLVAAKLTGVLTVTKDVAGGTYTVTRNATCNAAVMGLNGTATVLNGASKLTAQAGILAALGFKAVAGVCNDTAENIEGE